MRPCRGSWALPCFLLLSCGPGSPAPTGTSSAIQDAQAHPRDPRTNYAIRAGSLEWVQACAGKLPPEKTELVDGRMYELCRKPDFYYSGPTKFRKSVRGNGLALAYKIRFFVLPLDTGETDARALLDLAQ